jgi:primosomal protein N'
VQKRVFRKENEKLKNRKPLSRMLKQMLKERKEKKRAVKNEVDMEISDIRKRKRKRIIEREEKKDEEISANESIEEKSDEEEEKMNEEGNNKIRKVENVSSNDCEESKKETLFKEVDNGSGGKIIYFKRSGVGLLYNLFLFFLLHCYDLFALKNLCMVIPKRK